MEKSARTRLLTAVVLIVVLGAGVLLGMALKPSAPAVAAATASETQAADSAGRRHRTPIYMQLNPTPEQKQKLDSLLQKNREAMRALTKAFHDEFDPRYDSLHQEYEEKYVPRYDSLIASTRAAIRKVLTPEQVEKYDSIIAQLDARSDSMRASGDRRRGERGSRDQD
jgi:Spy/CpxP family protein refolding chaperone